VTLSQTSPTFVNRWTYDAAGQIVSIQRTVGGTETFRQTLTYDPVGNRTRLLLRDGTNTTYSYDAKNRLTQDATVGINTHTYNYSYDSTDNILTNSESGTLTTNTYDLASRITTALAGATVTTFSFDNNSNNIGVNTASALTTMAYDKENRLVTYLASGTSVSYTYSGDSLKRTEWNAGTPTTLVWDGQDYLEGRS